MLTVSVHLSSNALLSSGEKLQPLSLPCAHIDEYIFLVICGICKDLKDFSATAFCSLRLN
jgi:hypothetical protein